MHRPLIFGLTLTLLLSFGAPAVRAEDAASDIPGTLLVGPSINSAVGGAVVDRVWRIELREGRVGMVRIQGEPGAELGLYIFDRSASSIVHDAPLKSAALPGPSQSLVVGLPAGTYYINVNGRNLDRTYAFTLSLSLFPDLTGPELRPRTSSGSKRVSGTSATINPQAFDGLSGVTALRYRFDDGPWSEWVEYSAQLRVALPAVEGPHSLFMEARNGVGLSSDPAPLLLYVDRTDPTATAIGGILSGFTTSARPTITYRFSESMSRASIQRALTVTTFFGKGVPGLVTYNEATLSATFTPDESLELGGTYAVDLVGATDIAGNSALSPGGWSFTYLSRTKLGIAASARTIAYGDVVKVSGTTSGIPSNDRVALEWSPNGSATWSQAGSAFVRKGTWSVVVSPSANGRYRVVYQSAGTRAPATSAELPITVRPALSLSGAAGYVRSRSAGVTVSLRGLADPIGAQIVFARYRCNASFTSCVRDGGVTATLDESGRMVGTWVATKGYWGFRLKSAGSATQLGASTGLLKFSVK